MIEKGLERLFEIVDEIEKDAPSARSIMAAYIARGVVDEVIPPSYLNDPVACDLGSDMIDRAKLLLSRDHVGARLEKIWGPGGDVYYRCPPSHRLMFALLERWPAGGRDEGGSGSTVARVPPVG